MRQGRSESSNGSDGQHGGVWYAKAVAGDAVSTQNGGGASSGSNHRHPWPMAAAGAAAWLQASPLGADDPTCDATIDRATRAISGHRSGHLQQQQEEHRLSHRLPAFFAILK